MTGQDLYGVGTPAVSGLVPALRSPQAFLGSAGFALGLTNALGGATAHLAISRQPAVFAWFGTQVNVSWLPSDFLLIVSLPLGGAPGTAGTGTASFPLSLASLLDPALAGTMLYAQAFVDDPWNPGVPFAASRALRVEITHPPVLFVGSNPFSGTNRPVAFVDPVSGTVQWQGSVSSAQAFGDAVFAHGGADLFVNAAGTVGILRCDRSGPTPVWSSFFQPGDSCYGVAHDWRGDFILTLVGSNSLTRELRVVDSRVGSATFGMLRATTTNLGAGASVQGFAFSRSGKRLAAWTSGSPTSFSLKLLDTDLSSPTFFQTLVTVPIPQAAGASLSWIAGGAFGPDDEVLTIAISGVGPRELARFHLPSSSWIDADPSTPGLQHLPLPAQPFGLSLSKDGRFAYVTGLNDITRFDFAPSFPYAATATTVYSVLGVSPVSCTLSHDDSRAAYFATTLRILNTATGATVHSLPLTALPYPVTIAWN